MVALSYIYYFDRIYMDLVNYWLQNGNGPSNVNVYGNLLVD